MYSIDVAYFCDCLVFCVCVFLSVFDTPTKPLGMQASII